MLSLSADDAVLAAGGKTYAGKDRIKGFGLVRITGYLGGKTESRKADARSEGPSTPRETARCVLVPHDRHSNESSPAQCGRGEARSEGRMGKV